MSLMCAVGGIGENKEVAVDSFTCIENSRPAGASYVLQLVDQRYPKQPKVPIGKSPGLRVQDRICGEPWRGRAAYYK